MSSNWFIRTRQMSEAGKGILLSEALATHMRSSRDRKIVENLFGDTIPLEDVISYFAAFYLYNYQGVRLLQLSADEELSIEDQEALEKQEREQLEIEVRQLLGEKQREEVDVSRLVSEFSIKLIDLFHDRSPHDEETEIEVRNLILEHLQMIPENYSANSEIDFINEITGWGNHWREDIYVKASGLKESALSLREELLRPHDEEVPETTVLKRGIEKIVGRTTFLETRVSVSGLPDSVWMEISKASISAYLNAGISQDALKKVHQLKVAVLERFEEDLETPTTLSDYEENLGFFIAEIFPDILDDRYDEATDILAAFMKFDSSDLHALLRSKGITNGEMIVQGLGMRSESTPDTEGPSYSKDELEEIGRSLRRIEKLEHTLEKPVKGMLKARGLRSSELDTVSIQTLTKNRSTLIAIEQQVLDELKKKTRVPEPEEIQRLLALRDEVKTDGISGIHASSSADIGSTLTHGNTMVALREDLVWHFTISLLKNISRLIETYLRSKQDLLRSKAILKSIYEDSDPTMQQLREEIIIDLAALRLNEIKTVHPELDADAICSWYHARQARTSIEKARADLKSSPSPVFEGIVDSSLHFEKLNFDNYAIAFDLMHRFLNQQRQLRLEKEEIALQAKLQKQKAVEAKRGQLDVHAFIYTKSHTAFRAIGRVGSSGLEWTANDDAKCANLLSFFVRRNHGRPICAVCGEIATKGKCSKHGKGNVKQSGDIDTLSSFVMRAFTDIKEGLLGAKAEPMSWDEARKIVQREISILKRRGKLTSKTDVNNLLAGEVNYILGPAIARVIGKYFNESLEYAARRSGIA